MRRPGVFILAACITFTLLFTLRRIVKPSISTTAATSPSSRGVGGRNRPPAVRHSNTDDAPSFSGASKKRVAKSPATTAPTELEAEPTAEIVDLPTTTTRPPWRLLKRPAPHALFPGGDKAVPRTTPAQLWPAPATLTCDDNPHFAFHPPIMSEEFKKHVLGKVRKIERNWKQWSSRYEQQDISKCMEHTPECQIFDCLQSAKAYRKCCVEHRLLRDTSLWVIEQLEKHHIRYFLSTGTALGAIRHFGTIIPWDTDVDIAVFPEDAPSVERIFANDNSHFFHRDGLGKRMYWVHASADGKPEDGPHVEIFYEPDYTRHTELLLPLEECLHTWYGRKGVSCPPGRMLDHWFQKGWDHYTGCHYHSDGVATLYSPGGRRQVKSC